MNEIRYLDDVTVQDIILIKNKNGYGQAKEPRNANTKQIIPKSEQKGKAKIVRKKRNEPSCN